jgi:hypothetical protein
VTIDDVVLNSASSLGLGIVSVLILILMIITFRNMLENSLDLAEFKARGL